MTLFDMISFVNAHGSEFTIASTFLTAVSAVLAVLAAFSSASSARRALHFTEEAERRSDIRTALFDAHAIKIECDRIKSLSEELKLNYQSLAIFSGVSGGSRDEMYQENSFEKYDYAKSLSDLADELIAKPNSFDCLDRKAIDDKKLSLSTTLLRISALREQMADELSTIRLRNSEALTLKLSNKIKS